MARHDIASAARKLALLIPRLGSPFNGEQLATVAAIERVLKSNGSDWHDLADAITADRRKVSLRTNSPRRKPAPAPWRPAIRALLASAAPLLLWERQYCCQCLFNVQRLSSKQRRCLEDILRQYGGRAA